MHKIVYDHQTFCLQAYGGISRYFCELATRVAQLPGFDTKVVAPFHYNRHLAESSALQTALHLHVDKPEWGRWCRAANSALAPWLNRVSRPALIHRTFYKPLPTPAGVPVVVTVFDMIHELFSSEFRADDATLHFKRRSVESADHVLCISQSTARDLMRLFGTPADKISVTYLGCSAVFAAPQTPGETSPHLRPYLLYVGHRGGYKNFDGVLQAYAASSALQNAFDLMVFGGPPLSSDELALIGRLGIAHHRVVHRGGSDADLALIYRHARAFVYPSRYEGFGIPPLEAMSSGCAVACANTSSLPEVVGDAAVLFDPDDTDAMRRALETVCFDGEVRAQVLAAAPARVKALTWERCALDTAAAYARTIG
jgi:glycosyltransferase involved in cell wall biosynthesis